MSESNKQGVTEYVDIMWNQLRSSLRRERSTGPLGRQITARPNGLTLAESPISFLLA